MKAMRTIALLTPLLLSVQAFASQLVIEHKYSQQANSESSVVVVFAAQDQSVALDNWSDATQTMVTAAFTAKDFSGKHGQMVEVLAPAGLSAQRLIVVGVGEANAFNRVKAEQLGAKLLGSLPQDTAVTLVASLLDNSAVAPAIAQ